MQIFRKKQSALLEFSLFFLQMLILLHGYCFVIVSFVYSIQVIDDSVYVFMV